MLTANRHTKLGALARVFFLGVLLFGQCGLMATFSFAGDGHSHDHLAFGDRAQAIASVQMAPTVDVCCVDTAVVASKETSMPKSPLDVAVVDIPTLPGSVVSDRGMPSRAPPLRLPSERTHTLLQIYLI